jgi:hypothetical protein
LVSMKYNKERCRKPAQPLWGPRHGCRGMVVRRTLWTIDTPTNTEMQKLSETHLEICEEDIDGRCKSAAHHSDGRPQMVRARLRLRLGLEAVVEVDWLPERTRYEAQLSHAWQKSRRTGELSQGPAPGPGSLPSDTCQR